MILKNNVLGKKFKLDYYYFDTSDKLSDPFFNINTPDDLEEAKYD